METGDNPDDEDDGREEYQANWSRSDPDTISSAIVRAVATSKNVNATEIVTPLNRVLDADALVNVLASGCGNGDITVTFEFADRVITARDDGCITVRPTE